jgi:hypothetical protein
MPRRAAKPNGIFGFIGGAVKRSRAVGRAKHAYGRELKAARRLEDARARRQAAEREVKSRREEAATRKRDDAARKAAEKRGRQERERAEKQQRQEQERENKAQQREAEKRERDEQRERDKEEAAHRKAMLQEQAQRKREAQIEERERRQIAAAEERERKSYAGRMRRRPTYSQSSYEMNPARRKSKRTPRRNPPRRRGGIVDTVVEGVKGGAVAWGVGKAVNLLPLPQGQYARPLAKIGIGAAVAVYGERLPFVSRDTAHVAGLIIIGMAAIEGYNALVAQSPLAQFPVIGNGQLNAGTVGALSGASPYSTEAAGDMLNWGAVGYQFE